MSPSRPVGPRCENEGTRRRGERRMRAVRERNLFWFFISCAVWWRGALLVSYNNFSMSSSSRLSSRVLSTGGRNPSRGPYDHAHTLIVLHVHRCTAAAFCPCSGLSLGGTMLTTTFFASPLSFPPIPDRTREKPKVRLAVENPL